MALLHQKGKTACVKSGLRETQYRGLSSEGRHANGQMPILKKGADAMLKWKMTVLGLCLAVLATAGSDVRAAARQPQRLTMLVVPANPAQLELAFDVADRFPAVLVSYQTRKKSDEPLLHAWNGSEWVYLSFESYQRGDFMTRVPSRAILVGDETLLPAALVTASAWCPSVMNIPALNPAVILNSLSRVFTFTENDWRWFARRYNLELKDLNAKRRRTSWYD